MRRTARVAALLALGPALWAPMALAQDARPEFSVDESRLPPLVFVQPKAERDRQSLIAAGAGAVIGIIAVDAVTGGLALAPLGLPSFASLAAAPAPAGAAAATPVTYTMVQQVLAGVTAMVGALGGGYLGMLVAGPVRAP